MKMTTAALLGACLCLAGHMNAGTIYGGFEDTVGSDYDYNDLVFTLTGASLTLNSTASLFSEPTLNGGVSTYGQFGNPFWNNDSIDGANLNIGFCVYVGCAGQPALDPAADYLAANTSTTGSANNVTFSASGSVTLTVSAEISGDHNVIGWYSLASPGTINWLDQPPGPELGTFSFNPGGNFGLVANNNDSSGGPYFSNTALGDGGDSVSHFAFFEDPPAAPEPSTFLLVGFGLIGLALIGQQRRLSHARSRAQRQ